VRVGDWSGPKAVMRLGELLLDSVTDLGSSFTSDNLSMGKIGRESNNLGNFPLEIYTLNNLLAKISLLMVNCPLENVFLSAES